MKQTLYIKNVYPYNIDSQHTNITFRYQIINSLKTYETVILKKENIFSGANLIKFFQAQLGIQE